MTLNKPVLIGCRKGLSSTLKCCRHSVNEAAVGRDWYPVSKPYIQSSLSLYWFGIPPPILLLSGVKAGRWKLCKRLWRGAKAFKDQSSGDIDLDGGPYCAGNELGSNRGLFIFCCALRLLHFFSVVTKHWIDMSRRRIWALWQQFNEILWLPVWHFWHIPESIFLHLGIIGIQITNSAFIQETKQSIPPDIKGPTSCVFGELGDLLYSHFGKISYFQ